MISFKFAVASGLLASLLLVGSQQVFEPAVSDAVATSTEPAAYDPHLPQQWTIVISHLHVPDTKYYNDLPGWLITPTGEVKIIPAAWREWALGIVEGEELVHSKLPAAIASWHAPASFDDRNIEYLRNGWTVNYRRMPNVVSYQRGVYFFSVAN